jgi:hypothetical protein
MVRRVRAAIVNTLLAIASLLLGYVDLARDIAEAQGIAFIDATPALRAAASAQVIHGLRDWDHLNEIGYRTLGSLVAAHVR